MDVSHHKELNHKKNWLDERCLGLVYRDMTSSFEELLQNDNSVSIHYRNIQIFKNIHSLLGGISKNYDGYLPIEPNFRLQHKTPT